MERPEGRAHPVSPHDVGGRLEMGGPRPLDKDEHAAALWEYRVDAMMMLLSHSSRALLSMDELRRNVEALGAAAYASMSYYERWTAAIAAILLDRGVVTSNELGHRMAAVEARGVGTG